MIYDQLFTNGRFIDNDRTEAIIRLIKATGIINRNINGKTFIEDIKENTGKNYDYLDLNWDY